MNNPTSPFFPGGSGDGFSLFIDFLKGNEREARHTIEPYTWHVDLDRREISTEGVNFFTGIHERFAITHRGTWFSLNGKKSQKLYLPKVLAACEKTIRLCQSIEKFAEAYGKPIIIISRGLHAPPGSVFRDYFTAKNHPHIRYVAIKPGYDGYFDKTNPKISKTISVADLGLHTTCRTPNRPIASRFEKWLDDGHGDSVATPHSVYLSQSRENKRVPEKYSTDPDVVRIYNEYFAGRRIIGCLPRMTFDLGVRKDGGPGHVDMRDWLHHTIDILGEDKDSLLVIKPHPDELKPQIAGAWAERVRDILPDSLPERVVFLGHHSIESSDLHKILSVGLFWSGTAVLELTAAGVPVIVASDHGVTDFPLPVIAPTSRENYADLLQKGGFKEVEPKTRLRSAQVSAFMGSQWVSIPQTYSTRQLTNDRLWAPRWDVAAMEKLIRNGDPHMEYAADLVVEGLTAWTGSKASAQASVTP